MDSIIIVGMKHSGKSSLGKGLAAYFSLEFFASFSDKFDLLPKN